MFASGPYCDTGECQTCWDYCCIPECNDDGTPNYDSLNSGCTDGAGDYKSKRIVFQLHRAPSTGHSLWTDAYS